MQASIHQLLAAGLLGLSLVSGHAMAADDSEKKPASQAEQTTEAQNTVVAIVNGTDITRAALDLALDVANRSTSGEPVDEDSILEELITIELARQEAKQSGLAERDDIKAKIKEFTDNLTLNAWTKEKSASFEFSEEELKAAYDKRMAETSKHEYHARHILLKDEEKAEAVIKELLSKKTDFAELARKESTGPSGPMGGDLGWFRPDAMVPPFAEAIIKMEVGEINKDPIQTQFGWHVIKLEEKRDVKLPEFENMKPQLQRLMEQEKLDNFLKDLRNTAEVKILLPAKPAKADTFSTEESTENKEETPKTEAQEQASEAAEKQNNN